MSAGLHADRARSLNSGFTPIHGAMLQRKCACGGSSGLTGSCSKCEQKKLLGQPLQTKLPINEPGDEYEQEADRLAEQVMKIPDALPRPTAMAHSASVGTASITERHFIHGEPSAAGIGPESVRRKEIDGNALGRTPPVLIQRKVDDDEKAPDRGSSDVKGRKAELEFHSALHFNRSFSGFNPTAEPEEGGYGILWWSVWNTGWASAPEHTNRLTLYNADLCSGCRNDKDEISRSEIPGPAIVPGTEPGKSEYENAVIIGPLSAGHYDAYVELDVRKQVEEINEDNNLAFMVFNVRLSKEPESAAQATVQRKNHPGPAADIDLHLDSIIGGQNGGGQPLDPATREFFSARFGHDFANVRVHADAEAAESARAVNALAYTVGRDVVFGAGQYAPGTQTGQQLLAHELTHVVQQSAAASRMQPAPADKTEADYQRLVKQGKWCRDTEKSAALHYSKDAK